THRSSVAAENYWGLTSTLLILDRLQSLADDRAASARHRLISQGRHPGETFFVAPGCPSVTEGRRRLGPPAFILREGEGRRRLPMLKAFTVATEVQPSIVMAGGESSRPVWAGSRPQDGLGSPRPPGPCGEAERDEDHEDHSARCLNQPTSHVPSRRSSIR